MLRKADQVLNDLAALPGFGPVKSQVDELLAGLEKARQRSPALSTGPNMVFLGQAGTGKTLLAHALGDIYRDRGILRKGHMVDASKPTLVAGFIGQTAIKTREKCEQALDGILLIEDPYELAAVENQFGSEPGALATILKFMDEHPNRVVVVLSGEPAQMQPFLAGYPDLASRFDKIIHFRDYDTPALCGILRLLAAQQKFVLPAGFESRVSPWIEAWRNDPNWANARMMRTLFETVREAQAVRRSGKPDANDDRIEMADIDAAIREHSPRV